MSLLSVFWQVNSSADTETFCVLDYSLTATFTCLVWMWTMSRCVSVCTFQVTWPPSGGYLTTGCSWVLTYSLTLSLRPPPPPLAPPPLSPHQRSPVDVSRVTILPVSMTTTCCCPPLICLSLPLFLHSLSLYFFSLSVVSILSTHCWYFKVKEGHSQIVRYRQRLGRKVGVSRAITTGMKTDRGRLEEKESPRHCYC